MSERSGARDGKETAPSRHRGQSEVVGMVLLVGAIMIGAFLTITVGGMALQAIQDSTTGGLTQDTAQEAHAALSQAATTGDPQAIPVGEGAVDARLVEGGNLTISMHDGGRACPRTVEEDLGALRYEGGDRAMIYEGGAIWMETESGLAIERAPPISHDEETTRVSVLSVSAAATTDEGRLVAEPNESERQRVARETSWLLTACPAQEFTDLRITISSPYSEAWKEHFEERVATTPNVTVTRVDDDTVQATIENATEPRDLDGLGLLDANGPAAVSPGEDFVLTTDVANGNFTAADATVTLDVEGTSVSDSERFEVDAFDVERRQLTIDAGTINASLEPGRSYDYTVELTDDDGTLIESWNGSFVVGTTDAMVRLSGANHTLDAAEETLTVEATLSNYGLEDGDGDVTLEFTDPDVDAPNRTVSDVVVNATASKEVAFQLDVAALPIGHYEYALHGPNGTETGAFVIDDRTEQTPIAGDLRLRNLSAPGTTVGVGDSFAVDAVLENVGADATSGTVSLRVDDGPNVTRSVGLGPGDRTDETLALSAANVSTLETGETHEYEIAIESGGETETLEGSFYLGEDGSALGVESVEATQANGTVVVNATLDNDGLENATDAATLSVYGPDGEVTFDETPERTVTTRWGTTQTITFRFDGSSLGGNHTLSVDYGEEAASDTANFGALEGGDGGVAISGAGEGTVRVLGTEVSAEYRWGNDWIKRWAPIGVTVVENRSGVETDHQLTNDETSMDLANDRNLNTHDTQFEEWVWEWEQDADETMHLTLGSTIWSYDVNSCDPPLRSDWNVRNGPGYDENRYWEDRHPADGYYERDCVDPLTVDASSGDHPNNVRVLVDGDEVPDLTRGYPDQRTAAEVLNQGAADRIDEDTGELTLSSNEAVFLFEMTDPDATWEEALATDGEPDYNDVIAIVEFETPDGDVPIQMDVSDDGTGVVFQSPSVDGPGSGSVATGDITTTPGDAAAPGSDPGTNGTMPAGPTPPEDVDVEVDVVQVG